MDLDDGAMDMSAVLVEKGGDPAPRVSVGATPEDANANDGEIGMGMVQDGRYTRRDTTVCFDIDGAQ